MPNKTITTTVTLHVKDVKRSKPFQFNAFGAPISGKHVVIEVPPGKPVSLDATEADRILARHGGEEVNDTPVAVAPPKEDDVEDDGPAASVVPPKDTKPSK